MRVRTHMVFRSSLLITIIVALAGCEPASKRFIILSDLHPHPTGFEQLEAVTAHVIDLEPAFVVVLGDIGGDQVPGASEREIDAIRAAFDRMRAAGIEVFPVMGNHDVHPRVEQLKIDWFCAQSPVPLNHLFDARKRTEAYELFTARGPYNYSFNRGGIHFSVIDSNTIPPREGWTPERIEAARPRWQQHEQWMIDEFCHHRNNPRRLPTLVFVHHPEYMTGDRRMDERPLYRILADCPDEHTVKAVFGGHWHNGQNFSAEQNLGIDVYATQVSVHPGTRSDFIVADITDDGLVFSVLDSVTGSPGGTHVTYHKLAGRFTSLAR